MSFEHPEQAAPALSSFGGLRACVFWHPFWILFETLFRKGVFDGSLAPFSFASVEEDLSVGEVLQKMKTESRELIVN